MADEPTAKLLTNKEDFAKAKRNALLWVVSLIALVAATNSDTIKPTGLAAGFEISKSLLMLGLVAGMFYHLYALWMERWYVIWNHPDIKSGEPGSLPEKIAAQKAKVNQLADTAIVDGAQFEILKAEVVTSLDDVTAAAIVFDKATHAAFDEILSRYNGLYNHVQATYPRELAMLQGPYEASLPNLPLVSEELQPKIVYARDQLSSFFASADSAKALSTELAQTYTGLNRISSDVAGRERKNFAIYEVGLTFALAGIALALAAWDFSGRPWL